MAVVAADAAFSKEMPQCAREKLAAAESRVAGTLAAKIAERHENVKTDLFYGFVRTSFDFRGCRGISADVRGEADGVLAVSLDPEGREEVCPIRVSVRGETQTAEAPCRIPDGVHALYFTFRGTGVLDFLSFELKT